MDSGKINNLEQLISIRKMAYYDGKEAGRKILLIDNGPLSFGIELDKCFDIYQLRHEGTNISFISKNGLVGYDKNFIESFPGGMLYTCGLELVGNGNPMHGSIHNIPSTIKSIFNDGKHFEVVGVVRNTGLFMDNLVLERTISGDYGSNLINIKTEIRNEGYKKASYCLLFHMNIGYPMLDENVKILIDSKEVIGRTPWATQNINMHNVFEKNIDETEEQVFYHHVNNGLVSIINQNINKVVEIKYDNKMFTELVEWKSLASGDYALGIEPSTTTLDDGFTLKEIEAKSSHIYIVSIEIRNI